MLGDYSPEILTRQRSPLFIAVDRSVAMLTDLDQHYLDFLRTGYNGRWMGFR